MNDNIRNSKSVKKDRKYRAIVNFVLWIIAIFAGIALIFTSYKPGGIGLIIVGFHKTISVIFKIKKGVQIEQFDQRSRYNALFTKAGMVAGSLQRNDMKVYSFSGCILSVGYILILFDSIRIILQFFILIGLFQAYSPSF